MAILARGEAPREVRRGVPGHDDDVEARYIECDFRGLRIASVYLPNGNPAPGPRFDYKLAWLARLHRHAGTLLDVGVPTVLAGDFNVVPTNADIYNWWPWQHDAVLQPETRAAWQEFLAQGWTDVTRARRPQERIYSFWVNTDAFRRNAGFRMDFLLASQGLLPRVTGDGVDREYRGREKPSDHTPVWMGLAWP